MTINVSTVVDVSIAVAENFPARAGFGTLLFLTQEAGVLSAPELTRTYNDITSVTDDWPSDSEVVAAATSYFSQSPRPTIFKVGIASAGVPSGNGANTETLFGFANGQGNNLVDGRSDSLAFAAYGSAGTDWYSAALVDIAAKTADGTYWFQTTSEGTNTEPNIGIGMMQVGGQTLLDTLGQGTNQFGYYNSGDLIVDNVTLVADPVPQNSVVGIAYTVSGASRSAEVYIDGVLSEQIALNDNVDYVPAMAGQEGVPVVIDLTTTGPSGISAWGDRLVVATTSTAAPFHSSNPAVDNLTNLNISDFSAGISYQIDNEPVVSFDVGQQTPDIATGIAQINAYIAANHGGEATVAASGSGLTITYTGTDPNVKRIAIQPEYFFNNGDFAGEFNFGAGSTIQERFVATGEAPASLSQTLTNIDTFDDQWYGLVISKELRTKANQEEVALWVEARTKVFGNTTNDPEVLNSTSVDDIGVILRDRNLRRTLTTYSSTVDDYPSASILGRAFTTNFNQPNSTITLMFKQGPGILVEDISGSQKTVLREKNVSGFFKIGEKAFYDDSAMANGAFFDEVHGVDWLQNAIETQVCGFLLSRTTKVPYTDKGVAAIQQQVQFVLDEAVRNGLIAPGTTVDGEYLSKGYKVTTVPVAEINQSDVDRRFYGGLSFVVLGAGAIHRVQINGTFER